MFRQLRLVGSRSGNGRFSISSLLNRNAASLYRKAHKSIYGAHSRGIFVQREGSVADHAAAVGLALEKNSDILQTKGATGGTKLAPKPFSSTKDPRHGLGTLLEAKFLMDAQAIRNSTASYECREIEIQHRVAAKACTKYGHVTGINIKRSHFSLGLFIKISDPGI